MSSRRLHPPAMVPEVLDHLRIREVRAGIVADLTLGTAGHALAILDANPHLRVVGFDRDEKSLAVAEERLASAGVLDRCRLVHADYGSLNEHLDNSEASSVVGVLLDAGISLFQLDDPERGMSFQGHGRLDMRLSASQETTAVQVVNEWSEEALLELFRAYGEQPGRARSIARTLCRRRRRRPIETSADLVSAITAAFADRPDRSLSPAVTRTFAALRTAVNDEFSVLEDGLRAAARALAPGGRLVALLYSSREDGVAKKTLSALSGSGSGPPAPVLAASPSLKIITKKPLVPSRREIKANPRARTAKLRCAERLGSEEASGSG